MKKTPEHYLKSSMIYQLTTISLILKWERYVLVRKSSLENAKRILEVIAIAGQVFALSPF